MCDQNAQYVIRLEAEIPLFQSCRLAPEDETQRENEHCQGLCLPACHLSSVTLEIPHLSTLHWLPL